MKSAWFFERLQLAAAMLYVDKVGMARQSASYWIGAGCMLPTRVACVLRPSLLSIGRMRSRTLSSTETLLIT